MSEAIQTYTLDGFAIYNTETHQYINDVLGEIEYIKDAYFHNSQKDAQSEIENRISYPEKYEIHKVKLNFDIVKIIKRKVTYEEMEDKE